MTPSEFKSWLHREWSRYTNKAKSSNEIDMSRESRTANKAKAHVLSQVMDQFERVSFTFPDDVECLKCRCIFRSADPKAHRLCNECNRINKHAGKRPTKIPSNGRGPTVKD